MAVTRTKTDTDPPKADDPPKEEAPPKADPPGDDLEEKIERVLRRLLPQISSDDKPASGKPPTRAEREVTIEAQVKEQMDKLRADEKSDTERATILKKMESFEAAIKKEAAPITYGKFARFFFPGANKAKAADS